MKTFTITLYEFNDLTDEAKQRAANDNAEVWASDIREEEAVNIQDALKNEFGVVNAEVLDFEYGASLTGMLDLAEFLTKIGEAEGTWEFYEILRRFAADIQERFKDVLDDAERNGERLVIDIKGAGRFYVPVAQMDATRTLSDEDRIGELSNAVTEWIVDSVCTYITKALNEAEAWAGSVEYMKDVAEWNELLFFKDGEIASLSQLGVEEVQHDNDSSS